jgi:hypothetical protein
VPTCGGPVGARDVRVAAFTPGQGFARLVSCRRPAARNCCNSFSTAW